MSKLRVTILVLLAVASVPASLMAQNAVAGQGSRGVFIESADGLWRTALQFRLQFRATNPYDSDPNDLGDFDAETTQTHIRRARLKVDGQGFKPWLKFNVEFDLAGGSLLSYEVRAEPRPEFNFKVGQWKAMYSGERIVSSGRQLTVDRSIVNRPFTIDRQQGVSFYGHLGAGTAADVNYWVSAFTGLGRGVTRNDDEDLMYMGRLQWSPIGAQAPFRGGDNARSESPRMYLAVAGATNNSPCTRFSGSGCGQLEGYAGGGDYRINQTTVETAFHYRGFSWLSELHWKWIQDNDSGDETELSGGYAMVGYFPSEIIEVFPEPLELGLRVAKFNPDETVQDLDWEEITFALNWFFADHANKVTAEYAHISADDGLMVRSGGRWRFQWDVSF